MTPAIAYLVTEGKLHFLCVNEDGGRGPCHRYEIGLCSVAMLNNDSAPILLSYVQRQPAALKNCYWP